MEFHPGDMLIRASKTEKDKTYPLPGAIFFAVVAVAIILALIPWYSHYLQIESLRRAEHGDQASALHAAEAAVEVNPVSVQGRFVLAGVQQRLGREAEARKTLVQAVAMQPLNYATWLQLALYERDRWGQEELAQRHFAVAISLSPFDDQMQVDAGVKDLEQIGR